MEEKVDLKDHLNNTRIECHKQRSRQSGTLETSLEGNLTVRFMLLQVTVTVLLDEQSHLI